MRSCCENAWFRETRRDPGHSLARLGKGHMGQPLYAQDFVRFCNWERADSEERNANLAFSQVVGSQRGGVSLDFASRDDSPCGVRLHELWPLIKTSCAP